MKNINNQEWHEEIVENEKKLIPLRAEHDKVEKQIQKLCNRNRYLKESIDADIFNSFPKDIKLLTKNQWEIIFEHGHHTSSFSYDYSTKLFRSHGWNTFGFIQETNQFSMYISQYTKFDEKFFDFYKYIFKYVKPITVDERRGTEIGIPLYVSGICSNTTSVAYIHDDKTVNFYIDKYCEVKKYNSFKEFIKWLQEKYKQIESSCIKEEY